jgi:O-antigen ligase
MTRFPYFISHSHLSSCFPICLILPKSFCTFLTCLVFENVVSYMVVPHMYLPFFIWKCVTLLIEKLQLVLSDGGRDGTDLF